MPVVNDKNMPLFSFLVSLLTDADTQKRFRATPEEEMNKYNLTWQQKVAVYHAGADPLYVTNQRVDGYPIILDKEQVSAGEPNPVTGDWWAAYARFKAQVDAGIAAPKPIPSPQVNDRGKGERASMAGLMALLGDELSQSESWNGPW